MQRSLEPTRPLARVKGIVCSKKEKRDKKIAKKDLTGPALLEISGYPRGPRVRRAEITSANIVGGSRCVTAGRHHEGVGHPKVGALQMPAEIERL